MAVVGLDTAAVADASTEAAFLSRINDERAAVGLAPLSVDSGLRAHARNHSAEMAASGGIYHSSSDELVAAAGTGWTKVGENVGKGGSVGALHDAFMASPGHKANILGEYNYAGVGVTISGDSIYVTVVFMQKGGGGGSTPTTTAPKPEPTTTAAPTTTTTTLPPTTTTTLIVGPDKPVTPGESCPTVAMWWWMCHA